MKKEPKKKMKNELTAKRLQLALSNANMKPQELADKSGVSKASISQYVNGSHVPGNISAGKMAKVLNVEKLWLMGFDVEMEVHEVGASNEYTRISAEIGKSDPRAQKMIIDYWKLSDADKKLFLDFIERLSKNSGD